MFSEKVIFIDDDRKWLIKNFIDFQNGDIANSKSPIHKRIFDLLKKHKIDYQKLKDILNNNSGHTLGPKVDARAVEGDIVIEREREGAIEGEKEKEKVKKEKVVILPFNSTAFSNAWKAWTDYKDVQFKFRYKTDSNEQIALKELSEKAENNEQTTIKIIQQSIANGWKGFFELKYKQTQNNGKYTPEDYQKLGNTIDEWFERKYGFITSAAVLKHK